MNIIEGKRKKEIIFGMKMLFILLILIISTTSNTGMGIHPFPLTTSTLANSDIFKKPINILSCTDSNETYDLYRVTINLTSTSDWTVLDIDSEEIIVSAITEITIGDDQKVSVYCNQDKKSISLSQPVEDAPETTVQAHVHLILYGLYNLSTLNMTCYKGDLGLVTIEIYNNNTDIPLKIFSTVNDQNIPEDPYNQYLFGFYDRLLMINGPIVTYPLESPYPRWVLAFYYPWYNMQSWGSPALSDKPLFPYNSGDPAAITRHIQWAEQYGIDVFISSWWGAYSGSDRNFQTLLTQAENSTLNVTIYFETLSGSFQTPELVIAHLKYVLENYSNHPRFLKLDGKPVVFLYAVDAVATQHGQTPLESWDHIITIVEQETGIDAIWIGDSLNPDYLSVFDGLHSYGPQGYYDYLDGIITLKSASVRTYHILDPSSEPKIWASPTFPGYDDRLLDRPSSLYISRDHGAVYNHSFHVAISSVPDWITITSFNEWWENTHIEPSQKYGYQYLQMTKKWVDVFKNEKPLVYFEKPKNGYLYIFDREIIPTPFDNTIIIGKITIEATVYDEDGMDRVEFYVDDVLKNTDSYLPYQWAWNETAFGVHEIQVIAYDDKGNNAKDKIELIIFNIGG